MANLSVTNTFSAGTTIVAADMNTNFSEIETWVNTTPGVLQLTGGTVTGAASFGDTVVVTGDLTVDTSTLKVDAANNVVRIGTATPRASYALDVSGDVNVTGTSAYGSSLAVGSSGTGHDVVFHSDTAGDNFTWDSTNVKLVITGTSATDALVVADGRLRVADRVYCEASDEANLLGVSGALVVGGDGTGTHLAMDTNEIQAKATDITAAELKLNPHGGSVSTGGDVTVGGELTVTGDIVGNGELKVGADDLDTKIHLGNQAGGTAFIEYDDDSINGDHIGFTVNGTEVMGMYAVAPTFPNLTSGTGTDLVITGFATIVSKSSSSRYKNIDSSVTMGDYLTPSMVDSLEPKMFSYKTDTENHPMIGFIAEDCDSISPFLAVHSVLDDGSSQTETIDTAALVALLSIGLKDARERLAILEA